MPAKGFIRNFKPLKILTEEQVEAIHPEHWGEHALLGGLSGDEDDRHRHLGAAHTHHSG
jgi:hypothetical protein